MEIIVAGYVIKQVVVDHEKPLKDVPKDKYFLCHIMFFLLGVCSFLPLFFFSAATNFWMYKFRNTTSENMDASQRTLLQKYYASDSQIASSIPSILFGLLNVLIANKFKIMTRVNVTQGIQMAVFILFAVFEKFNTDRYQFELFIALMVSLFILSSANAINTIVIMNLCARFPQQYMKTALVGQGAANIFADLAYILSITLFLNDTTNSTLIYFVSGASVVTLTFLLTIVVSKTEFFLYFVQSFPEQTENMPKKQELIEVVSKLRFAIVLIFLYFTGISMSHTAITSLVVSEDYGKKSLWADNYFTIVMTFLLADCSALFGRLISSYLPINVSENILIVVTTLLTIILVPMIWLCNAQPRKHLPIVFTHDYQYGVILGLYMVLLGYILNTVTLCIPQKLNPKEVDMGFNLFGLILNALASVLSPLGLLIVNIL